MTAMIKKKVLGRLALAATLTAGSAAVFGHRGEGSEGWRSFGSA